jgi:hypothetical protein
VTDDHNILIIDLVITGSSDAAGLPVIPAENSRRLHVAAGEEIIW